MIFTAPPVHAGITPAGFTSASTGLPANQSGGIFTCTSPDTTVKFDQSFTPAQNKVIFINGFNAEFDQTQIDLGESGALIVACAPAATGGCQPNTGNLTLYTNTGSPPFTLATMNVPPTAPLEYPYSSGSTPNPASWPCSSALPTPGTCSSNDSSHPFPAPGRVNFRGFLYVQGNVNVQANDWHLVGAVRVDGQLSTGATTGLTILYDDKINHNILVNPIAMNGSSIQLQTDTIQEVAAQ